MLFLLEILFHEYDQKIGREVEGLFWFVDNNFRCNSFFSKILLGNCCLTKRKKKSV